MLESNNVAAKKTRKRRNDRNHVIYLITCDATGDTYIGITIATGRAYQKSIMKRWTKHLYHALVEKRTGLLQIAIREHGPEVFSHTVIEIVRGKKATHKRELDLIAEFAPTLNVEGTNRKRRGVRSAKAA